MTKLKGGNKNSLFSQWKKILFILFLNLCLTLPICFNYTQIAWAQDEKNQETSTSTQIKIEVPDTGPTDINTIWNNIWNLLFGAAGIVAVIFIIYAGYMYITSAGNTEQMSKAKTQIIAAVIGLIIIIASVAIVEFVNQALHGNLHLFSANLSNLSQNPKYVSNSSQSPTSPTSSNKKIPEKTSSVDQTNLSDNDKKQLTTCINYYEQQKKCYNQLLDILESPDYCASDIIKNTQAEVLACHNIEELITPLYETLLPQTNIIIGGAAGFSDYEKNCFEHLPSSPPSCPANSSKTEISKAINNIKKQSNQTVASPTTPTTHTTKPLTAYQQCRQEAETNYKTCQNKLSQACYTQQKAYEPCLGGLLGTVNRLFSWRLCKDLKTKYYDCKNNWQKICSTRRSEALELCRIRYQ